MANTFESELMKLMAQFQPEGGFGIQGLGGFQDLLRRQSSQGLRAAQGGDQFRLNRAGLGRSVAGATSGGTRQQQFSQSLMDALTQLQAKHSQLGESQRQGLMGLLSPVAQQRANRPSFLSSLFGGLGGLAGQALIPGIGGGLGSKLGSFLGGGGPAGQGFANTNNFSLRR